MKTYKQEQDNLLETSLTIFSLKAFLSLLNGDAEILISKSRFSVSYDLIGSFE